MSKADIFFNGKLHTLKFTPPVSLSKLITACGVKFSFPCSEKGICASCKVTAKGSLSPLTAKETELFGENNEKSFRLACSTLALGDVTITDIPVSSPEKAKISRKTLKPISPLGTNLGIAFDIGTTTIAAYLCDLKSGKIICDVTFKNNQSVFGEDVLSRIESSLNGHLNELSTLIKDTLYEALVSLCDISGINSSDIDSCVITGNTSMLYFLENKSPVSISKAPFKSDDLFGHFIDADFLKLKCGTKAYIVKCISAFIGGDITCSIIASSLNDSQKLSDKTKLLIDIGTNGETVLLKDKKLFVCSCAAGPAFESVGISHGMPAVTGAVNSFNSSNFSVIGDVSPIGICGTGLIDILSYLTENEKATTNGLLKEDFYLKNTNLSINQKDIRNLQLAKSAVISGIETLLECENITYNDIESFEIAGSFGNFLNIKSALNIGLIPKELESKTVTIGNAAGLGACMILFDKTLINFIDKLTTDVTHIELADSEYFSKKLIENTSL